MPDVYVVYVLRSETTGRRYIGSCQDLHERFRQHNAGESKATKHGVPWKLGTQEKQLRCLKYAEGIASFSPG
jgi:predicted GIY-YIG superfamily endonuclease